MNGSFNLTNVTAVSGSGDINVEGAITIPAGTTWSHTGWLTPDGAAAQNVTIGNKTLKMNCVGAGGIGNMDIGSSIITLKGTLDGNGTGTIVATGGTGFLPGSPTPTITDLDASGTNMIFAFGIADGGGNANVLFAPPGGGTLEVGRPGVRVPGLNVGAAA